MSCRFLVMHVWKSYGSVRLQNSQISCISAISHYFLHAYLDWSNVKSDLETCYWVGLNELLANYIA